MKQKLIQIRDQQILLHHYYHHYKRTKDWKKIKPEKEQTGITKRELIDEVIQLILGDYEISATIIASVTHFESRKCKIQRFETFMENFDLLNQCKYQWNPRYWKLDSTIFIPESFWS